MGSITVSHLTSPVVVKYTVAFEGGGSAVKPLALSGSLVGDLGIGRWQRGNSGTD